MIRRILKDLLCRVGLGSLLIEYCDDCGIEQPVVWWCKDQALWNHVTGGSGSHCPTCFSRRAEELGILVHWFAERHP